jgi:hypothetical protein
MKNEKQNRHMQSALNDLQQLPDGFVFNSQEVWAGLEQQLPKKQQKKANWYYAAAAILLIAGTTCFLFLNKTKQAANTPVTVNTVVSPAEKMISLPSHQQKNKEPLITHTSRTVKQTVRANPTDLSEQKELVQFSIQQSQPAAAISEQTTTTIPSVEKHYQNTESCTLMNWINPLSRQPTRLPGLS